MAAITGQKIGAELVEPWGFKNCMDLKIHIPKGGIVIITAEFYATEEQMKEFVRIVKKYKLEEIIE